MIKIVEPRYYFWRFPMNLAYVKTGFCPEEIEKIDMLISKGYGKNRSDLVRKATNDYLSKMLSEQEYRI